MVLRTHASAQTSPNTNTTYLRAEQTLMTYSPNSDAGLSCPSGRRPGRRARPGRAGCVAICLRRGRHSFGSVAQRLRSSQDAPGWGGRKLGTRAARRASPPDSPPRIGPSQVRLLPEPLRNYLQVQHSHKSTATCEPVRGRHSLLPAAWTVTRNDLSASCDPDDLRVGTTGSWVRRSHSSVNNPRSFDAAARLVTGRRKDGRANDSQVGSTPTGERFLTNRIDHGVSRCM